MTQRARLIAIGCFLSFSALAGNGLLSVVSPPENHENRWSIIGSLGYGEYQHMYRNTGQTPIGRLALGVELLTTNQGILGLELGVQNGNRMRLAVPYPRLQNAEMTVQSTVKPVLDLLFTANTNLLSESLLFTQFKGGIAYRQWQIDSDFVNSRGELAGEVQAGFGYPITEITSLNLLYQGIFGGNPRFRTNTLSEAGHIASIPVQHGLLLGFSVIA